MEEQDSTTGSSTCSSSDLLPEGKDYHAFMCFNSANEKWVNETIAYLESPGIGLKCVDHRRDFHPGKTVVGNIEEFVETSWKYILVMSPDFVDSDWCKFETDIMVNMSLEQREECIIPVLLEPCLVPKALKSLTYIDVSQSDRWKERLVKAIRRYDSTIKGRKLSMMEMRQLFEDTQSKKREYQEVVDQYKKDKQNLENDKKMVTSQIDNAYSLCIKNMVEMMEKQRDKIKEDIHVIFDDRMVNLVERKNTARKILSELDSSISNNNQALKNFSHHFEEFKRRDEIQKGTSYTEFVPSTTLLEKMTDLMSEFDAGFLREMDITQVKSQEDRDNFLKEISPSWAIIPESGKLTPWSIIRCPHFDYMTAHGNRSILPDGSLYNQPPFRPRCQSEKALKQYRGAVGSIRFIAGSVVYWENKVDVDMEKVLKERNILFEIALSTNGVYDERHCLDAETSSLVLSVFGCPDHATNCICLQIWRYGIVAHHRVIHPNTTGHWPLISFGFKLDTLRHRWTIYDVEKKEVIFTVKDIGDVEQFTPMFGVYNPLSLKIKLSLVTGTQLLMSDEMYKLILSD